MQVLIADDQMLPKFRASVDVSLFTSPSSTIDVSVNSLTQKVVVEASTDPAEGPLKTLKQNVTLPRFADENNIEHSINADGILEVSIFNQLINVVPVLLNGNDKDGKSSSQVTRSQRRSQDFTLGDHRS